MIRLSSYLPLGKIVNMRFIGMIAHKTVDEINILCLSKI